METFSLHRLLCNRWAQVSQVCCPLRQFGFRSYHFHSPVWQARPFIPFCFYYQASTFQSCPLILMSPCALFSMLHIQCHLHTVSTKRLLRLVLWSNLRPCCTSLLSAGPWWSPTVTSKLPVSPRQLNLWRRSFLYISRISPTYLHYHWIGNKVLEANSAREEKEDQ